jgi:hypothetical protein
MNKADIHRKPALRILILIASVVLFGFFSNTANAGMLQKAGVTLKKNFGPQIMLDQTLMNVNIPLNISNMPGPWKNAKLEAVAIVYFLNATGETTGYGLGEGGENFTPLEVTLDNGGYNGTVAFPIRVSMGAITGKTCCVTIVMAELGNQRMFVGASTGGTAPNSGQCGNIDWSGITPGTIMPY